MGQQQLLLLVLATVIVGIAIVVGINAFSEKSVTTNYDSLLQDAMRVATDAQAWKSKPQLFGGSPDATKADADDFTGVDFIDLGYAAATVTGATNQCYGNLNGVYQLTPAATGLTIEAISVTNQNLITVQVDGILTSDVSLSATAAEQVRGGQMTDGSGAQAVSSPTCT
jgi:hypothetical protein